MFKLILNILAESEGGRAGKVFTMIGHDGNFNGHEVVGGSAVEGQCAPAAYTETMKVM